MLTHNRQMTISVGGSREAVKWKPQTLFWSEFLNKLETPVRSTETLVTYLNMPKSQQDTLKDVGGFVGGALHGERRKAHCVISRDLICLDLDRIPAGGTADVLRRVNALGCAYAVYSTRKHEEAKPRLRVVLPLHRAATGEEYEPVARKMGEILGMDFCDPTTFQAHRLMYWPSCCSDSQYVFTYGDKPFLDTDGVLRLYTDWRDVTQWPQCAGQEQVRNKALTKLGDPKEKRGIIGAFCRVYDVYRAMDELIPGEYEPTEQEGRYTFVGGSTAGGALVYENGTYLYSHHATDPAGGRLSNAFDLVRLHKFGMLDEEAKPDTPVNSLPSYRAMCQFAVADGAVSRLMAQEDFGLDAAGASTSYETPQNAYESPQTPQNGTYETPQIAYETQNADTGWVAQLERDENGAYKKTVNNTILLIEHAPELNGCVSKDVFANRVYAEDKLPWRVEPGCWGDADTTRLRAFLEIRFRYKPAKQDVKDAVIAIAVQRRFHPVKTYLEGLKWDGAPRLDTLFTDYLGVEDSVYTRAVTRKTLVGAVARVMTPGCKFDYMPILLGRQGCGKSTMIRKLAVNDDWFSDSLVTFDGAKAFEALMGKWLIEIPEMNTFDRTTMNQAKAFITKQGDFFRAAYAEFPEERSRQCIFIGTTNDPDCLRDNTGGRRYWPLDTDAVPRTKNLFTDLAAERDQVWAEAFFRWQLGEPLYLPREIEAIAAERQEEHRSQHPWESVIQEFVDKELPLDWVDWPLDKRMLYWQGLVSGELQTHPRRVVCAREVWQEALGLPLAQLDRRKAGEITDILGSLRGWVRHTTGRFGPIYGTQKCFLRVN